MESKIIKLIYFVGLGVGILGAIYLHLFLASKVLIILALAILGIFFSSFGIHEYFKLKDRRLNKNG